MSADPDSPGRVQVDSRRRRRRRQRLVVEITGSSPARAAASGLCGWLEAVAPGRARGAVALALVSDAEMRAIHRRYLGRDRVTDVLSFPAGISESWPAGAGPHPLGDLVIATGRARRQAQAAGHTLGAELRLLALHGLLHLLGYDHEADDGRMARVERRLRRQGGLVHGLIERTSRPAPRRAGRTR
jgi:probable rRNA maturation factor